MARAVTVLAFIIVATLFGWGVPLTRLYDAIQPMIVATSIMAAAILVRLNRGMPTLDWKGAAPDDRKKLTTGIVALSVDYGRIIAVAGATLIGLVALTVVGKNDIAALWPDWATRTTSAAIGGLAALCVARMSYVIWRDIDIVRLQKTLIDAAAVKEEAELQATRADEKVGNMKGSNLRRFPVAAPRAWED